MTEEEGTVSGALDFMLDAAGHGLVRYHGTETWLTIGNIDGDEPRTWTELTELTQAVSAAGDDRDSAGNVIPFEA